MATQFGNECYCSTEEDLDYDRHKTGDCDMPCTGDEVSWRSPLGSTVKNTAALAG